MQELLVLMQELELSELVDDVLLDELDELLLDELDELLDEL
jgi:hypothetical protein